MKLITHMVLLISALALMATSAQAEEGAPPSNDVVYVELKPSFVTNYQSRKMGYLKADVTLKVKGGQTAEAVDRHKPAIRHHLVMLFSSQSAEALGSMEGKEMLKETALSEVVAALQEEGEPADVEDILFTSFIVD
ncbi:MAG: flagellar basal body-associated FliL family protein [Pseudomonadota bacterium]|nr:flagellar basal body-associated FliL family protein [Pseudomonadota bacterium]